MIFKYFTWWNTLSIIVVVFSSCRFKAWTSPEIISCFQSEEWILFFKKNSEQKGWLNTTLSWEPVSIINYAGTDSSFTQPFLNKGPINWGVVNPESSSRFIFPLKKGFFNRSEVSGKPPFLNLPVVVVVVNS